MIFVSNTCEWQKYRSVVESAFHANDAAVIERMGDRAESYRIGTRIRANFLLDGSEPDLVFACQTHTQTEQDEPQTVYGRTLSFPAGVLRDYTENCMFLGSAYVIGGKLPNNSRSLRIASLREILGITVTKREISRPQGRTIEIAETNGYL